MGSEAREESMNRKEALEHFKEHYLEAKSTEKMEQVTSYYEIHKEELKNNFIDAFRKICIKIKEMQNKGVKGNIGYITYSFKRLDIAERKYVYIIEAFNEEWFYDEVECMEEYDVSWAFGFLDEFEQELQEKSKLYIDKITKADMEKFRLEEIGIYHDEIVKLSRYAMPEAAKLEDYRDILKHEVIEVRVGEYKGISEVVYKEDTRVKDSDQVKEWLEEKKEGEYDYEILKDLNLSEGDYEGISLKYGDLSGSNLSKCILKKCSFIGTKFENTNLANADLSQSSLYDGEFKNACMINTILHRAKGGNVNFQNTNMENVNMSEADMAFLKIKNANLKN